MTITARTSPEPITRTDPTVPGQEIIALQGVTFYYAPESPIIQDFDWRIHEGESWGLLGPSGCGKTTLLYLLAGLRKPLAGTVCFRGQPLAGPSHDVGLMLQDYGLLPWMTAERNVQIGLKIRGIPRRERHRIRAQWLERMQISHVARSYPAQMSGGQRQRVALARVLALETDVLLLDEPLSAVDEFTREQLQTALWEIKTDLQSTMVLVTHSVEEAALLTENILIFPDNGALHNPVVLRSPFAGDGMPTRGNPSFQQFCARIREALGL
jgi:ABC-type nitrate/sulfonate/bicarbonate transport system ATPase subunit